MFTLAATATVTLRKRKRLSVDTGVLHLSSSPSPGSDVYSESDYEPQPGPSTIPATTTIDGPNIASLDKKRYSCSYEGCSKTYSKPSRLAEHERSHTGDVSNYAARPVREYSRPSRDHFSARNATSRISGNLICRHIPAPTSLTPSGRSNAWNLAVTKDFGPRNIYASIPNSILEKNPSK